MTVRIEKSGSVWTVIHSRPEARNAMDPKSADDLVAAFEQATGLRVDVHLVLVALAVLVAAAAVARHVPDGRIEHAAPAGPSDPVATVRRGRLVALAAIGGLPPNLTRIPPGCPFNPRCRYVQDVCRHDPRPPLREVQPGRLAACHFSELLLVDSPKLEVTQSPDEVQRAMEFSPDGSGLPAGVDVGEPALEGRIFPDQPGGAA